MLPVISMSCSVQEVENITRVNYYNPGARLIEWTFAVTKATNRTK